tara:strand:+ start:377 stop:859 length:483 start_codon:yes stop_codon:yes gene_type:complete
VKVKKPHLLNIFRNCRVVSFAELIYRIFINFSINLPSIYLHLLLEAIRFNFIGMKTIFTILKWGFGLAALPMILQGFLFPIIRGSGNSESVFILLLSIPLVLLAIFFHTRAKKRQWEDDFFYLLFKFSASKGGQVKNSLKQEVEKTKEALKDNLDKEKND